MRSINFLLLTYLLDPAYRQAVTEAIIAFVVVVVVQTILLSTWRRRQQR